MKKTYSYSILKYIHDTATGEFVNIGVALLCEEDRIFKVKIKSNFGRVSDLFPDMKSDNLKLVIKTLKSRYTSLSEAYQTPLSLNENKQDISKLLKSILPKDDSALVWSVENQGISFDPLDTLDKIYDRYVTKYDAKKSTNRRSDKDIWRSFKKDLEDRRISSYFKEKVFQNDSDEVSFPLAWKNGIWHCVEPISFDLSGAESIREKAHKCLGQITSVNESLQDSKLYLLVSKPSDKQLEAAFDNALSILDKLPVSKEIYFEDDKTQLLNKLNKEIVEHEGLTT